MFLKIGDNNKYFYYICAKDEKRGEAICPIHRIPSADIEEIVTAQLAPILKAPEIVAQTALATGMEGVAVRDVLTSGLEAHMTAGEKNRLAALLIKQAVMYENRIEIEINTAGVKSLIEELKNETDGNIA